MESQDQPKVQEDNQGQRNDEARPFTIVNPEFERIKWKIDCVGALIRKDENSFVENFAPDIFEQFSQKMDSIEHFVENFLQFVQMMNLFKNKVVLKQAMTYEEERDWPMINAEDKSKLQNQNMEFSEFVNIFLDGQKIAIAIVPEITSYIENKFQALQVYVPEEIKAPNEAPQIQANGRFNQEPGSENEQVHVNQQQNLLDPQVFLESARGKNLKENLRDIYGRDQESKFNWYFDTHEEVHSQKPDYQSQLDRLEKNRQKMSDDRQKLIQTFLRKITNQSIQTVNDDSKMQIDSVVCQQHPDCGFFTDYQTALFGNKEYMYELNPDAAKDGRKYLIFKKLKKELHDIIEQRYQQFLQDLETNINHVEQFIFEDQGHIFQIDLNHQAHVKGDRFEIVNTATTESRPIIRSQEYPYIVIKSQKTEWVAKPINDQVSPIDVSNYRVQKIITDFYSDHCKPVVEVPRGQNQFSIRNNVLLDGQNMFGHALVDRNEFNVFRGQPEQQENDQDEDIDVACVPLKISTAYQQLNYLLTVEKQNHEQIIMYDFPKINQPIQNTYLLQKQAQPVDQFELIASFTEMQIPPGQTFAIKNLGPNDIEYEMCKYAMTSTNSSRMNSSSGRGLDQNITITGVQKIFNPTIFDKFAGELRRTLKKYPHKKTWDLFKLLFHGTKNTDPMLICGDEYGLDNRHSHNGMYGNGIYFANNSNYSRHYAYTKNRDEYQMFICFVLTGESIPLAPQKISVPPLKKDHQNQRDKTFSQVDNHQFQAPQHNANDNSRFDSIQNSHKEHYIIYDYNKQYPGYLITYKIA